MISKGAQTKTLSMVLVSPRPFSISTNKPAFDMANGPKDSKPSPPSRALAGIAPALACGVSPAPSINGASSIRAPVIIAGHRIAPGLLRIE